MLALGPLVGTALGRAMHLRNRGPCSRQAPRIYATIDRLAASGNDLRLEFPKGLRLRRTRLLRLTAMPSESLVTNTLAQEKETPGHCGNSRHPFLVVPRSISYRSRPLS
jgi:hypothetical protein